MKSAEIERIRRHTSQRSNDRIDRHIADTIREYAGKSEGALTVRIDELDREWDVERTLQAHASTLALAGLALGTTVHRRWFAFTGAVAGLLLLHAVEGWCPPLPLFRRLGLRTRAEIDRERFALKFLRGDFDLVRKPGDAIDVQALLRAAKV